MNVPLKNVLIVNSKPSSDAGEPSRPTVRPPAPPFPPQFTATRSGPRLDATRTDSSTSSADVTSVRTNSVLATELGGDLLAALLVEVGDDDVGTGRGRPPDRGLTEPGGAAGDDCSYTLEFHGAVLTPRTDRMRN